MRPASSDMVRWIAWERSSKSESLDRSLGTPSTLRLTVIPMISFSQFLSVLMSDVRVISLSRIIASPCTRLVPAETAFSPRLCRTASRNSLASPANLWNSRAAFLLRTAFVASRAASLALLACTHARELKTTPAMLAIVPTVANTQFHASTVMRSSFARCRWQHSTPEFPSAARRAPASRGRGRAAGGCARW